MAAAKQRERFCTAATGRLGFAVATGHIEVLAVGRVRETAFHQRPPLAAIHLKVRITVGLVPLTPVQPQTPRPDPVLRPELSEIGLLELAINPRRITSTIEDTSDPNHVVFDLIVDRKWESVTQEAIKTFDLAVYPGV